MAQRSKHASTSTQPRKKSGAGIESAFASLELVVLNYVFNGDPKWLYGRAEYVSGYLAYFPRIFPSEESGTTDEEGDGESSSILRSKPYPPQITRLRGALLKFENEARSYIRRSEE